MWGPRNTQRDCKGIVRAFSEQESIRFHKGIVSGPYKVFAVLTHVVPLK